MHALCASRVCSLWLSSLALSLTRAHTTPRPSFTHSLAPSDPRSLVPLHQEPVKTFQKGPPPEKAKLKRWWTYLSQFRLTVNHIPGIKNKMADYISRNNFDALLGESSDALAKEAFQRMDVQLDLSMRTAGVLEGWSLRDY